MVDGGDGGWWGRWMVGTVDGGDGKCELNIYKGYNITW